VISKGKRRSDYRGRKKVMAITGGVGFREVLGTHFWHKRIRPQPFLRPAFDENWQKSRDLMAKRLRKFIEGKETALGIGG